MGEWADYWYKMPRLSIPGCACVHCGTVIGKSVICPGCDWADPMTKRLPTELTDDRLVSEGADVSHDPEED